MKLTDVKMNSMGIPKTIHDFYCRGEHAVISYRTNDPPYITTQAVIIGDRLNKRDIMVNLSIPFTSIYGIKWALKEFFNELVE